jgi:hypothetical protein
MLGRPMACLACGHPTARFQFSSRKGVPAEVSNSQAPESRAAQCALTMSTNQLIRWMRQQGHEVNPAALAALRSGGDVGSADIVSALAKYLGIPEAILIDEAAANAIIPTLPLLKAMQDKKLRRLALRAGTLDPNDLQRVADLVNRLANVDQADIDLDF